MTFQGFHLFSLLFINTPVFFFFLSKLTWFAFISSVDISTITVTVTIITLLTVTQSWRLSRLTSHINASDYFNIVWLRRALCYSIVLIFPLLFSSCLYITVPCLIACAYYILILFFFSFFLIFFFFLPCVFVTDCFSSVLSKLLLLSIDGFQSFHSFCLCISNNVILIYYAVLIFIVLVILPWAVYSEFHFRYPNTFYHIFRTSMMSAVVKLHGEVCCERGKTRIFHRCGRVHMLLQQIGDIDLRSNYSHDFLCVFTQHHHHTTGP